MYYLIEVVLTTLSKLLMYPFYKILKKEMSSLLLKRLHMNGEQLDIGDGIVPSILMPFAVR